MKPLVLYQLASLVLLGAGLAGLVKRRTLVGMLIAVELMLNGAGLSIVAATQLTGADPALGQLATLLVMGLAAAEATVALAAIVVVFRRFGTTRTDALATLREQQ
ncbi:NADH-quinone oxidoreductase subunit NuoK [Nitratidesulfovibrio sp. SRB-5]|uniref:NADH-quinone oxidoreductase subunit K n=1 Tax=Nitratidesulfovibrio vulgaris (strain DSM 19637 / Miyazaki F) TaxID=883 RepID=B8DS09_NITV9|nr:NADH-quinone oxidoreductase subunit NuoK [Nitratidesulfovibrio sp. SRB-5]MBZ2172243.1 NADH-quinone oxidoreductase subunit NuoK [Nitratidesulfovibrio sp. SRB-5]RXF77204.1 NADH-quinone oxidoreductase subunit NuoK [Desulfovibrio sp. DS-1]